MNVIIIKKTKQQQYKFMCPICGTYLTATKDEADETIQPNPHKTIYRYTCISCHKSFYLEEKAMTPIHEKGTQKARPHKKRPHYSEDEMKELNDCIRKMDLTIDHFRAYQYGEPFEGEPVEMRHSFDLTNDDGDIIVMALDYTRSMLEKLKRIAEKNG